jgi:hypothetical protein
MGWGGMREGGARPAWEVSTVPALLLSMCRPSSRGNPRAAASRGTRPCCSPALRRSPRSRVQPTIRHRRCGGGWAAAVVCAPGACGPARGRQPATKFRVGTAEWKGRVVGVVIRAAMPLHVRVPQRLGHAGRRGLQEFQRKPGQGGGAQHRPLHHLLGERGRGEAGQMPDAWPGLSVWKQ